MPLYGSNFLLSDASGGAYVTRESGAAVSPGDKVRVKGTVEYDESRFAVLRARETEHLGSAAPVEPMTADAALIPAGSCDWKPVRVKGFVRNAFRDEIDPRWNILVLNCNSRLVYAAFPDPEIPDDKLTSLIDAVVTVKGACLPSCGGRRFFFGIHVEMSGFRDIEITEPAPADPFDTPVLDDIRHLQPDDVFGMRRRRVSGSVIAVWHKDRILIETSDGRLVRAELLENVKPPACGDGVEVVGFPETDLFRINLSRALYRSAKVFPRKTEPVDVTPADILLAPDGRSHVKTEYYGRTVRLRGFVRNVPPAGLGRMNVDCNGYLVPVETGPCPESVRNIPIGTELELTGVCIFDTENWRPPALFPRIEEFLLAVRSKDDVKVISRPSWWTPGRLGVIIGLLLAALGGIAVWNRLLNRLVERRSLALLKERAAHDGASLKVEERTRLAVELHDTLAQNLTGISLQIDAAQMAAEEDPATVMPYLETARRKMQNCRETLRNCLWDLRSRAFEEKELSEAIRKTIAPHTGRTDASIDMDIPCRKLSDNTIHAVLCIIRELVVNAIRHGNAGHVTITGSMDEKLSFSVSDDGNGFDPATRPGLSEGHFGLQGVMERTHRLGGTFEIASTPGKGTVAKLGGLAPDL